MSAVDHTGTPLPEADTTDKKRDRLLLRLHRRREDLRRSAKQLSWTWHSLSLLVAIVGAATSVLVALGFGSDDNPYKPIVVMLPLIGGLISTVVTQFKIHERWVMRESGAIHVARLVNSAKAMSYKDEADFKSQRLQIEEQLTQVQEQQALGVPAMFKAME